MTGGALPCILYMWGIFFNSLLKMFVDKHQLKCNYATDISRVIIFQLNETVSLVEILIDNVDINIT